MNESPQNSDRVVFAAAIILALISVAMYFTIFLTLFRYGVLNDTGRTFAIISLVISAVAMLLACFLALAGRSRTLTTTGLSGSGWAFVCAGLIVGAPAVGLEMNATGSAGGVPAALFLIIAGAAILQAERNVRQANDQESV